jgi:hypothetical protein
MELIVHIGQGKTGSSSIQKTLHQNKDLLTSVNTVYVGLNFELAPKKVADWQKAGAWNELLYAEDNVKQLAHVIDVNLSSLSKQGVTKVIWSNESLFASPEVVIPALNAIKNKGIKISVICYIRRHDSWARSAYLQWGVKHKAEAGVVKPFSEWIANRKIHFSSALEQWHQFDCENVFVRNFDETKNLIDDFSQCAALPTDDIKPIRDNDTPGNVALNLWALYNSQFEEPMLPHDMQSFLDEAGILSKSYHSVDLQHLFPSNEDLHGVLNKCSADIEKINAIFRENNQAEFSNKALSNKNYNVELPGLICGLLDMIKFQHAKLENFETRLSKLEEK